MHIDDIVDDIICTLDSRSESLQHSDYDSPIIIPSKYS